MKINLVSEVELTVKSINSDQSEIHLFGSFDQSTATFEGTFTCSQNLKAAWLSDPKDTKKNKFKLVGHECQNRAVRLLSSTDLNDARFTTYRDPETGIDKFCAIGNLRLTKDNINSGYNRATVDIVDLDDKTMVLSQISKVRKINLPKTFSEIRNDKGETSLPYHIFMPFKLLDL